MSSITDRATTGGRLCRDAGPGDAGLRLPRCPLGHHGRGAAGQRRRRLCPVALEYRRLGRRGADPDARPGRGVRRAERRHRSCSARRPSPRAATAPPSAGLSGIGHPGQTDHRVSPHARVARGAQRTPMPSSSVPDRLFTNLIPSLLIKEINDAVRAEPGAQDLCLQPDDPAQPDGGLLGRRPRAHDPAALWPALRLCAGASRRRDQPRGAAALPRQRRGPGGAPAGGERRTRRWRSSPIRLRRWSWSRARS